MAEWRVSGGSGGAVRVWNGDSTGGEFIPDLLELARRENLEGGSDAAQIAKARGATSGEVLSWLWRNGKLVIDIYNWEFVYNKSSKKGGR